MATPASKNNPGATPTQITSSPFPSAVPMGRPLSHMSPSMRTPSASGHVQQHPGTSSHQYPTPLAATVTAEDAAAFGSPSALLALGLSGITPSPAGNDILAGQGIGDNDIQSMGMTPLAMPGPRNNDEEKRRNIEEVIRLLRTRVAGRGVCRESVERLGKLEGFECMWQENDLSIAGNSVDLEIEFEDGRDTVKDVTLRYATPDVQEGEKREEASAVLKRNLVLSPNRPPNEFWKNPNDFHENLQRLARLDQLSREVNCFEAVEGLYESMRRIWEEEKKANPSQNCWQHLCISSVAKPSMHAANRVGLALQYWIEQRQMMGSRMSSLQRQQGQETPGTNEEAQIPERVKLWNAVIECETGYPPLRISKEWVAPEVFMNIDNDGTDGNGNPNTNLINWVEPPQTMVSPLENNPDAVGLDSSLLASTPPNVRFILRLEPPVSVPTLAATEIYRLLGVDLPQVMRLVTYDSLIVPLSAVDGDEVEKRQLFNGRTLRRVVYKFDEDGQPIKCKHAYTFHTIEHVPGRTIRHLPFSHPRQISEILPILRQYAFISSLYLRIFAMTKTEFAPASPPETNTLDPSLKDTTVISNVDPTEHRLDRLLSDSAQPSGHGRGSNVTQLAPSSNSPPPHPIDQDVTRVDVSLKIPLSSCPYLLLLFCVQPNVQPSNTPAVPETLRTVTVRIDIGPNGYITVPWVSGTYFNNSSSDGEPGTHIGEHEIATLKLREKLAKVLETCEDIGMLVEWLMKWLRKHNSTGDSQNKSQS